jgi:hypothetical protein
MKPFGYEFDVYVPNETGVGSAHAPIALLVAYLNSTFVNDIFIKKIIY